MARLILLGTGAAFSDETREHTYMVAQGKRESILVDCGGSPIQRLTKAGVSLASVDHVILTHHHPDHMYGLSVFLLDLWLTKRKKVLQIYGLRETLRAARAMLHALEWERWIAQGFFPVEFIAVPKRKCGTPIITPEFSIFTTPTAHMVPTIATRIISSASGKSIAYSSDTEPCVAVVELATDADILFHEATTLKRSAFGHSSARQAGEQAQRARAKKLVLVHLPPHADAVKTRATAKEEFTGPVIVGKDFARFEF